MRALLLLAAPAAASQEYLWPGHGVGWSCEASHQGKDLGRQESPAQCWAAAMAEPSCHGSFMFPNTAEAGNLAWGCRCCSRDFTHSVTPTSQNDNWKLYRYTPPQKVGPSCYCMGDPHCHTFDHYKYDWMGECDYTLVKDAASGFEVQGRNSDRKSWSSATQVSMMYEAMVKTPSGDEILLKRDPRCWGGPQGAPAYPPWYPKFTPGFFVNGNAVSIPYAGVGYTITYLPGDDDFAGWKPGAKTVAVTLLDIKATVIWTICHKLEIRLQSDSPLKGATEGLCGDSDGIWDNDPHLAMQECHHKAGSGKSMWPGVKQQCAKSDDCEHPPPVTPCTDPAAEELCRPIMGWTACTADKVPFFEMCLMDACAMPDRPEMATANLDAYAAMCCDAEHVEVGKGCPPWQKPCATQGIGCEDEITGGDPFTSYGGKRTQFWLPLAGATPLLRHRGLTIRGEVTTGGAAGSQQWFRAFTVDVDGEEALSVAAVAGAATAAADTGDTDVVVETQSGAEPQQQPEPAAAPLAALRVTARGAPVAAAGTFRAANGSVAITVSSGQTEQVAVRAPGLSFRMWAAAVQKPGAPKVNHVDLAFSSINASACTGVLPEVWGVQPLSAQTAKYLVPPSH